MRCRNFATAKAPSLSLPTVYFVIAARSSVKILRWDTDGFLLYQKRLERGSFELPRINPVTGYYELSWETFSFIMAGVSLESVQFRKRNRTRFVGR